MINLPYGHDLLAEVHKVLSREFLPEVKAEKRYQLLMVLNAIGIAMRESTQTDQLYVDMLNRLGPLVGVVDLTIPETASRESRVHILLAVSKTLKLRIRNGYFDAGQNRTRLLAMLYEANVNALQISNPRAVRP